MRNGGGLPAFLIHWTPICPALPGLLGSSMPTGHNNIGAKQMTINDPRAKQALYMAQQRKSGGVPRRIWRVIYIVGPILIALAILWGLMF